MTDKYLMINKKLKTTTNMKDQLARDVFFDRML